ncbi:DUF7513 family protein [Halovenus salina]|uniref:DUF7513 domain-containing protein n=1 Tax=Halovenus salina TaxID=1510225 RepID=A0ABD5W5U9_9EURY|nr:hypothetical protein [Halovenus salina]
MSLLSRLLAGATFRTSKPEFDVGEEIEVYVTDYNESNDEVFARVGQTRLRFDNASSDLVGCRVLARIERFDLESHRGTVTHLKTVERSSW